MKFIRNTKYRIRNTNRRGFSFIEVMLSVFLMSMGMVASIILIGKGMRESIDSRNQLIASLLAQEGVELVRNIRDKNWVTPQDSFTGIVSGASPQKIDIISPSLAPIGASATLYYDSTNHRYAHTGGTATKFSREIIVANGANANERVVTSLVIWKGISFPSAPYSTTCTTKTGCSYAEATMTRWSE